MVGDDVRCYHLCCNRVGFSWTGDWVRFIGFEVGLEQLVPVATTKPMNYRFYYWNSWGFAGYEGQDYLAYDPDGEIARLSSSGSIKESACQIYNNRSMLPPWRLITAFECNLLGP